MEVWLAGEGNVSLDRGEDGVGGGGRRGLPREHITGRGFLVL